MSHETICSACGQEVPYPRVCLCRRETSADPLREGYRTEEDARIDDDRPRQTAEEFVVAYEARLPSALPEHPADRPDASIEAFREKCRRELAEAEVARLREAMAKARATFMRIANASGVIVGAVNIELLALRGSNDIGETLSAKPRGDAPKA